MVILEADVFAAGAPPRRRSLCRAYRLPHSGNGGGVLHTAGRARQGKSQEGSIHGPCGLIKPLGDIRMFALHLSLIRFANALWDTGKVL